MDLNEKRTLNMAVQVVPMDGDIFAIVDHAIQAIAARGVKYQVGPMETVMEGELDDLLAAARAAHLACFEAGAKGVMTYIKIGDHIQGTSIAEKMAPYRKPEAEKRAP
jgi:uncharacterized protein (TIGR00106 family)